MQKTDGKEDALMKRNWALKLKKGLLAATLGLCAFGVFAPLKVAMAAEENPITSNNKSYNSYGKSYFVTSSTGYVRVFEADEKIYVEEYDKDFKFKKRLEIKNELDVYGGFYSGKDAYYFVFGKYNTDEVVGSEVVRVVKYNKSWQRISAASLVDDDNFAHDVRYPFWGGTFDMEECGGNLYIATGHQSYVDPAYNMGHQGYILFVVDEKTMTGKLADADNWHSFSQFIACKDANTFYLAEESEGSGIAAVSENVYDASNTSYWGNYITPKSITALEYGGDRSGSWAVATYASVDGIALSKDNVLTIGTSIDQSRYDDSTYTKAYNVYLTVTPMDSFETEATSFKWITSYTTGSMPEHAYLVKLSNDRFAILWSEATSSEDVPSDKLDSLSLYKTSYVIVDGNGNIVSAKKSFRAPLSDCEPIVSSGKIVYYTSYAGTINFYSLDVSTGKLSKKCYRLAGEKCTWSYADGVLTIDGSGPMSKEFTARALTGIKDEITAVVVKGGVTEITEYAFSYLENLKTVVLENGVKTIDEHAFAGNLNLKSITIPASVTSIAEGCFNTGYYWIGSGNPVICVKIKCPKDSYAQKYADKYNISHENVVFDDKEVSQGLNPSDMGIKLGQKLEISSANAKVVVTKIGDSGSAVKYMGPVKAGKKATVPSTVTYLGTTYKVTAINANAFKNNKKLKEVVIGKYIISIGKNAFYGCKNLKKITVKSAQLKKVGSKAIKGTNKKLKIYVPKKKLKTYKKLFKSKGVKNIVIKGK